LLLRFAVLAAVVRDGFLTAVDALYFFPCAAFNRRIRLRAARAASDPPSPRGRNHKLPHCGRTPRAKSAAAVSS